MTARLRSPWLAGVVLAAVVYVAGFTILALERHHAYRTGYDLAIFDQLTWLLGHLDHPYSTIRGLPMLGDHFQPGVALLAPLGLVGHGPAALLTFQTVVVALNAPLLYLLARRRGAEAFLAALVALAWLASPLTHSTNLFDFHPETLVPALLTLGALALDAERPWLFVLTAIVACSLKEDVSLVYAMWGLVIAFRRRAVGLALAAAGVAWFVLALKVGIPLAGGSLDYFSHRFGGGNATLGTVLVDLARHPVRSAHALASGLNAKMVVDLVGSTLGLCLLEPRVLLLAGPTLAANILSRYQQQHYLTLQYHIVPAGVFALAAASGAFRLPALSSRLRGTMLAVGAVTALAVVVRPPGGDLLRGRTDPPGPAGPVRSALVDALSRVPDDAPLSIQYDGVSHAAHRRQVYVYPEPFVLAAGDGESWTAPELRRRASAVRWVITDGGPTYPATAAETARARRELARHGFRIVFAHAGVRLYRLGR